jgi:hypothetical protein
MRLLRCSDVKPSGDTKVFYSSRTRPVILLIVLATLCAGFAIYGWKHSSYLFYYIAGAILFFTALLRGYIIARFLPTNWILQLDTQGLFIKFRSYLNHELTDSDPTVVFLSYQEIRSVRLVRQRLNVTDASGGRSTRTIRQVEFEIVGDPAVLARALHDERTRAAPPKKRWYGTTSTLYRHYPVRLVKPAFLQIEWSSVVPSRAVLIDRLRPFSVIESKIVIEDFTKLESLSRAEQEQRLRELDARGELISAVYAARRLYGYSIADASLFIEDLRKKAEIGTGSA